jgi:alkylhydroperoxidase family enzyme
VSGRRAGVDAEVLAAVQGQLRAHDETWGPVVGEGGLVDPEIKDLCARYLAEDDDVVAHADDETRYDERQRAALAWAHAIGWNPDAADDALFERLRAHFSEPQLVQLGTFISLYLGQRNWLRTLGPLDEPPPPSARP